MKTFGTILESTGYKDAALLLGKLRAMSEDERSAVQVWGIRKHPPEFDLPLPALASRYDIDGLTSKLYDREYVTCDEVQAVTVNLNGLAVSEIFTLFNDYIPANICERLRGFQYTLPSMAFVRPDSYILNLIHVPASRVYEVSAALERGSTDTWAVHVHFGSGSTGEIPHTFMVNTLGLKNYSERDLVLVKWAFTKVHVKDAWLTATVLFNVMSIHDAAECMHMTETAVHGIVVCTLKQIKELMGLRPDDERTPMSVVERQVSKRLFRTINKAAYFEDLIDPELNGIKPSTSSVELVEELLRYCQEHGYTEAYISWVNGKGVVIYMEGSGKRA